MTIDTNVKTMFWVHDKMFKKDEDVVFASRIETVSDDYDDGIFYKVITIDDKGDTRKYIKDNNGGRWVCMIMN